MRGRRTVAKVSTGCHSVPESFLLRVHEVFERFEARDVEGVVGLFAADGVFADPHYPPPIGPAMVGYRATRGPLLGAHHRRPTPFRCAP